MKTRDVILCTMIAVSLLVTADVRAATGFADPRFRAAHAAGEPSYRTSGGRSTPRVNR